MPDGSFVAGVTINQRVVIFLEDTATAEVPQPTTVYAFTGQDSRERGTEMGFFYSSPVALPLLMPSVYGFSTVEVVRENPKKKTIQFGDIAIREHYLEMTYDTRYGEGQLYQEESPAIHGHQRPHPSARFHVS